MELKLVLVYHAEITLFLLIVPYGIEIFGSHGTA